MPRWRDGGPLIHKIGASGTPAWQTGALPHMESNRCTSMSPIHRRLRCPLCLLCRKLSILWFCLMNQAANMPDPFGQPFLRASVRKTEILNYETVDYRV